MLQRNVKFRIHTVASFDKTGDGVDYRYEDGLLYDACGDTLTEIEDKAIACAEAIYPKHRILTGVEILEIGGEEVSL